MTGKAQRLRAAIKKVLEMAEGGVLGMTDVEGVLELIDKPEEWGNDPMAFEKIAEDLFSGLTDSP